MYVVVVHFRVKPGFSEEFRTRVTTQAETSLAEEPGCHRFDVAFDPGDATKCLLYELYEDRAAFDTHLATAHFEDFSANVESGVVSKEVTFWELAR